ncbi:hypothetical protein [Shimia biformata]|nr:hypothetical protein [Shimia biformata]
MTFLIVASAVGLVSYAYLGPLFGVDFSPRQQEVRQPVTLNGD